MLSTGPVTCVQLTGYMTDFKLQTIRPSRWPRGLRPLGFWDREFEFR
jgi:hypothetical protein